MYNQFFVTGIGTGVGKTVVSTVITEALKADYYKPVQCGNLDATDSDFVREHLFNSKSIVHPEQFLLRMPASPHMAAANEGCSIELKKIILPASKNNLIVEGAGGALVPLNHKNEYVIDIARKNKIGVVLVVGYYLGSINHSLLTLHYLNSKKIPIKLIVFNGDKVEASKKAILNESGQTPYIEMERFEITPTTIKELADYHSKDLNSFLNN